MSIFFIMLFVGFKGNITGFFCIGSTFNKSPLLEQKNIIIIPGNGYDGQQFLTLALDPLLLNPQTKNALDDPYYRSKRIMYPLLGYIFGAGSPRVIPYSLVIINFFGLIFLIFIASLWLKQNSKPERWALIILSIPSVWVVLIRSTSELLCAAFILAALYYCYMKKKYFITIVFLTLAIFTKETAILALIVILFSTIVKKNYRFIIYLSIPVFLYILWNSYLYFILQRGHPSYLFLRHFSIPLEGIIWKYLSFLNANKYDVSLLFDMGGFFFLFSVVIIGMITAIKNFRIYPELSTLFTLQVLLFIMYTTAILDDFYSYTRICMEIYLFCFLMLSWSNRIIKKFIPIISIIISIGFIIGVFLQTWLIHA